MPSSEFLMTSLIVVLMPGTGVIYTISVGLFSGKRASIFAALGCTMGILPHIGASALGLATLLHVSAVAFQILKYVGVVYLLYLAWLMWRDTGVVSPDKSRVGTNSWQIAVRGFLINILNPKLSLFFLAFLPQFLPASAQIGVLDLLELGGIFMLLTLVVFIVYGLLADKARKWLMNSQHAGKLFRRLFSMMFAAMAARLALADR